MVNKFIWKYVDQRNVNDDIFIVIKDQRNVIIKRETPF